MSKIFFRAVAFLMLSVMLLSMFAACGGKDTEDDAQVSDNVSTVTDEVIDPDADGLPEKDYGGADFAVIWAILRDFGKYGCGALWAGGPGPAAAPGIVV